MDFEWSDLKESDNIKKHGVSFSDAKSAFYDANRVILLDEKHSGQEVRFLCLGKVKGATMTVRFTYRREVIRIFGAAYWRKGRKTYEKIQKNQTDEN